MNSVPCILLIDDDLSLLKALSGVLGDLGQVVTAGGVRDGLRLVEEMRPQVVVTDYLFEDGNGLDLAEKTAELSPSTKVILISAFADKQAAIRSIDLKIHALLEKPFSVETLRTRVRSALPPVAAFSLQKDLFTVRIDQRTVRLTPTEFTIFELLHDRRGKLIPREELQRLIWPDTKVSAHTLDTHFINLKKKLPEIQSLLVAVRSRGFVLE